MICSICNKMIFDTYIVDEGRFIHTECFTCDICNLPIEGSYIKDEWGNKIHSYHKNSETIFCDSCGKILIDNPIRYNDERYMCKLCYSKSIDSSDKAINELKTITDLLKEKGIKYNYPDIKIFLVSQSFLKKRLKHRGLGKLRGLCETKSSDNNSLGHKIFVLNGLPLVEFNGVLAHELLHTWLFENKITLPDDMCEGFCNLGTALVYKRSKTRLGEILFKNLENDSDPIYGDGFRKMKIILEKKGWKRLLEYVKSISFNYERN